jgi:streptomycin 6-kinase
VPDTGQQVSDSDDGVHARASRLARSWGVEIDSATETDSSLIAFGRRDAEAVVLKVVKRPGDEWLSGDVVHAFGGRGMARVLESRGGALLLERLVPATELVELTRCGRDDDATIILADVICAMAPGPPPASCPTVADWGRGFDRYLALGDARIPLGLVHRAAAMYSELCETQGPTRLLHGDLHHYNILDGGTRGWVSIDPKGVVGEVEYELGASLRNPAELPAIFADLTTINRRVSTLSSRLDVDAGRVLRWGFAQAVLSAIWLVEDGYEVDAATSAPLRLAGAIDRWGLGTSGLGTGDSAGSLLPPRSPPRPERHPGRVPSP